MSGKDMHAKYNAEMHTYEKLGGVCVLQPKYKRKTQHF